MLSLVDPSLATAEDERRLIAALRAGDDAAYETLVRTYAPRLFPVARRIVASDAEANDAVQDAFISAFKSIDRFSEESSLRTWLHRITVNAALMLLRSRRRRPEQRSIDELLPRFEANGHRVDTGGGWSTAAVEGLEREEKRRLLTRLLDELPDDSRTVLVLRDIEERGTAETAEVLGITPGAVKTRLHRARQALRTLLERELSE
ncbi:MAG: sigma-70 family RNA polymerase sigma factor [Phycisphaerales bacterium]|nr:sigma-70 family RNA polymerase sigma factor [Phycisphaerales bacterium]NNM26362.1 sigma-70 family RNA polymerase sigma factor [Phycisphaerales bacterium]